MKNNHIEYTSVDDLITELQTISKKGFGEYPVCVNGVSPVHVSSRPYYYDGGYLVRDATKGNYDFLRSRTRDENGKSLGMRPGVKDRCFDINTCNPTMSDHASIDGRTVRDMDVETWSFLDEKEQEEIQTFGGLVQYKLAKEKDDKLNCYPFTAYLESGESATGSSMYKARENLKKQFSKEENNDVDSRN